MAGFLMFNQGAGKWKDGFPNKTSGNGKCKKEKKVKKDEKCEEKM